MMGSSGWRHLLAVSSDNGRLGVQIGSMPSSEAQERNLFVLGKRSWDASLFAPLIVRQVPSLSWVAIPVIAREFDKVWHLFN